MRRIITLLLVVMCAFGWLTLVTDYLSKDDAYHQYIEQAQKMAQRGVPYQSSGAYRKALNEQESQELHQIYLEELRKLNNTTRYYEEIASYLKIYPTDTEYYQILIQYYYDTGENELLFQWYQTAKENGVSTAEMTTLYRHRYYEVVTLHGGYQWVGRYVDGYAVVEFGNQYGIVNQDGQLVVEAEYDYIDTPCQFIYGASKDGTSLLMHMNGEVYMRPTIAVDKIYTLADGYCVVERDGKNGICQWDCEIPEKMEYDEISRSANSVVAVRCGEKWSLMTADGQGITDWVYDDIVLDETTRCCSNYGVIFAKMDGQYRLLDLNGNQIGTELFDEVKQFASNQPAAVRQGETWTFLSLEGMLQDVSSKDEISSFSCGLYAKQRQNKWGYCVSDGEFVIEPIYDECHPFDKNGIARVRLGDSWSYITVVGFQE